MIRYNPDSDPDKVEELLKQIKIYGKVLNDLEIDKVKAYKRLLELSLELYTELPAVDVLYGDSPLAPNRILHAQKAHSKKLGMPGVKDIFTDADKIPEFSEAIRLACDWAERLVKQTENEEAV